jgi:hypothetical protein
MTRRLAMLLIGYIPLLHVAGCIAIWFIPQSIAVRTVAFVLALYLLPPLAARLTRVAPGTYPMHLGWWWSQQWQTLFNRFPFLEEVLRLLPSVYSLWLRLWGSHIGKLVYWAPGVAIVDRGLVDIGDSVVVGAGVRMGSHYFANDELLIARVTIGAHAVVGAYSTLAPGAVIKENESTPAVRVVRGRKNAA